MRDFEPPTDLDIDQLVDGTLTPDEERRVFDALDDAPEGWRRLALAFCEDRALRGPMADYVEGEKPALEAAPTPAAPARPRAARRGWFVTTVVGVTATVVGIGIGLGWERLLRTDEVVADVPAIESNDDPRPDDTTSVDGGTLELLVDDGRGVRRLQVPVVDATRANLEWMNVDRPLLPEDVRRIFEAAGHEIAESRQFLRIPLDDTRDALVPVGHVEVQRVEYQ